MQPLLVRLWSLDSGHSTLLPARTLRPTLIIPVWKLFSSASGLSALNSGLLHPLPWPARRRCMRGRWASLRGLRLGLRSYLTAPRTTLTAPLALHSGHRSLAIPVWTLFSSVSGHWTLNSCPRSLPCPPFRMTSCHRGLSGGVRPCTPCRLRLRPVLLLSPQPPFAPLQTLLTHSLYSALKQVSRASHPHS